MTTITVYPAHTHRLVSQVAITLLILHDCFDFLLDLMRLPKNNVSRGTYVSRGTFNGRLTAFLEEFPLCAGILLEYCHFCEQQ